MIDDLRRTLQFTAIPKPFERSDDQRRQRCRIDTRPDFLALFPRGNDRDKVRTPHSEGFESAFTKNGVAVVGIDCELPARRLQTPACW